MELTGATAGVTALLTAVWADPEAADRVAGDLLRPDSAAPVDRPHVATLVLTGDGRLRIRRGEPTGAGVLISGVIGAALGVLVGGREWLMLGGGALQRLAAVAVAAGMDTTPLRELADRLPTVGSVVIAAAPPDVAAALQSELSGPTAQVTVQTLDPIVVQATGLSAAVRYDAGDVDGDVIAVRRTADCGTDRRPASGRLAAPTEPGTDKYPHQHRECPERGRSEQ